MPEEKPTVDKALELFVYAPVGVALYVRDMLPTMMGVFVSRGRREVQSHLPVPGPGPGGAPTEPPAPSPADVRRKVEEGLGLARVVTESGVGMARGMAGTGLGLARGLADTAVQGLGSVQGSWVPGGSGTVAGDATGRSGTSDVPAPTTPTEPSASAASARRPADAANGAAESSEADPPSAASNVPDVATLAIPDYDELSASQVVERLEGLDAASLDAIRRYESAHRGRNTILGKIAQLG